MGSGLFGGEGMRLAFATIAVAVLATGACTDQKIVFRDRPSFNPPPDSINGFLGYFTVATKQTTCGNCHVGTQNQWGSTKHAQAWVDLQGSGHASSACNKCHTVSELGNAIGHAAGYSTVPDSAYHDVQCESCHGPGFTHVENPDITANQPLARMHVDTGVTTSCSGCHLTLPATEIDRIKKAPPDAFFTCDQCGRILVVS